MDSNQKGLCSLLASMGTAYIAGIQLEPYYFAAGDAAGNIQEQYPGIIDKIADMPETAMQIANMGGSLDPFTSGIAFGVASILFTAYALVQTGKAEQAKFGTYDNSQTDDIADTIGRSDRK